jgi:hypothetical protein
VSAVGSIRIGDGAFGAPAMKFTLLYEGELRSNDDYRRKWEIRKYVHPQLEDLWRIDQGLVTVRKNRIIPKASYFLTEMHHDLPEGVQAPVEDGMDLLIPIIRGNRQFFPLVRNSLDLRCGLKITFLRKEEPGRIYQGGDLDNRLKTLFDALSVPTNEQIAEDPSIGDPIYCLLEDDGLISRIDVETGKLLAQPNATKHDVRLIVEVNVRVAHARLYNQVFLGD